MGQVESLETASSTEGTPRVRIDTRAVQIFHGLRPELLQQLEDLRALVHEVNGTDLGIDPVMDPECTVHDAVSSLLSQYVDKVGSLSNTVRDTASLVPLSFSPSPSFSSSPYPVVASPASTSSAMTDFMPFPSSLSTSASTSAAASAANSASTSASGTDMLTPPSTPPPPERTRARVMKRPMKRFSAGKWVTAVVKAMGMTTNRSQLDRLESGLEALARAEHDWLAAKLSAVAGKALRLPPSRVEEVTAVGLAVWVEFWNSWAGKRLNKAGTSSSSSALPPRPSSSASTRKLQHTPSSKFWAEKEFNPFPLPPVHQPFSRQASWKDRKPPPLTVVEPPTPSTAARRNLLQERQRDAYTRAQTEVYQHHRHDPEVMSVTGSFGLGMRPEVPDEAAFLDVNLGNNGDDDAGEDLSPKEFDDMVPISLEGEDKNRGGKELQKEPTMPAQAQTSLFGVSLQPFGDRSHSSDSAVASAATDVQQSGGSGNKEEEPPLIEIPTERAESKKYGGSRYVDMEQEMRADIGSRLQKTLLEECLQEGTENRKGLEAAPPSHAEIVRLLGLAASSAGLRQVSAAACVLRLLDALGREWRGDEVPAGVSPHVQKDWDRFLETKECRGFVLQCLVDLLDACNLRCKTRNSSGIPEGDDSTPTGKVSRLTSLGDDEFATTPQMQGLFPTDRSTGERGWPEGQSLDAIPTPRDSNASYEGDSEEEEGLDVPCPASLVELSESTLVWKAFHRKDINEAQKFQELDRVFEKPVGPGILALALADEAQKLRHLSNQDLWALSDQVEDLGCFEAAFRLRLRAIAGEYEDMDAVVEVVRVAYHTRGVESIPLRLKRLVDTAKFALTHAPSATARHDYAMTFGACMLEPLLEDPSYPWAFEIADNYVGLSGLFGPVEKGEEEDVQLRTKLLCARVIMKTVVEPLLVETGDATDEGGGSSDDLSALLSRMMAEGKNSASMSKTLAGRLRGQIEKDQKEDKTRRRKRKEKALRSWAEGVDYPGIEVGWLQWQAIGMLLQSHNPYHPALVTMWAKAVRGNFKSINEEGSSTDKEAVELFDWGLEGLLVTFAGDGKMLQASPLPSPSPSACSPHSLSIHTPNAMSPHPFSTDRGNRSTNGFSEGSKGEAACDEECEREEGEESEVETPREHEHAIISLRDHCMREDEPMKRKKEKPRPGLLEVTGRQHPDLVPTTPRSLPFDCEWIEYMLDTVRPREREKADFLLAVASRMASAIYWKWPKRKENQKFIARMLLYLHRVVGLSEGQKRRAMKVGERIWGWMLPNASLVRDQCETDEEAQDIMENAIFATWIGASA